MSSLENYAGCDAILETPELRSLQDVIDGYDEWVASKEGRKFETEFAKLMISNLTNRV